MSGQEAIELEKDIIGCMLRDSSIIADVAQYLGEDDFSSERTRAVYRALTELDAEGAMIDQEIVMMRSSVQCAAIIAESHDRVATGANWEYYAKLLKNISVEDQLRAILRRGLDARRPDETALDVLSKTLTELEALADASTKKGVVRLQDLVGEAITKVQEAVARKSALVGRPSGLAEIDECMGGIRTEFIILGARPSIGKSALAVQLAYHDACNGTPALIFAMEQRDIDLVMRLLAAESSVKAGNIQSGFLKMGDLQAIQDAAGRLYQSVRVGDDGREEPIPLYFCDSTDDLDEMLAITRYFVRKRGVKTVVFDHLDLIHFAGEERIMQAGGAMRHISGRLQKTQRRLKITLIALAQLKRDAESTRNKNVRPVISDINGSKAVEQDADQIWLMHRNRDEEGPVSDTEVICAKGRNGGAGTAHLVFSRDFVRFRDDPQAKSKNQG